MRLLISRSVIRTRFKCRKLCCVSTQHRAKPGGYLYGAVLTEVQMNAGNKGVDKEHEDHHTKDGHTLHQESLVTYSVLSRGKQKISGNVARCRVACEGLELRLTFFCSS